MLIVITIKWFKSLFVVIFRDVLGFLQHPTILRLQIGHCQNLSHSREPILDSYECCGMFFDFNSSWQEKKNQNPETESLKSYDV